MRWVEKEFGRELTTRTWKTVGRILKKIGLTYDPLLLSVFSGF
nr:hypothetical protein [Methanobacterium formicicum]